MHQCEKQYKELFQHNHTALLLPPSHLVGSSGGVAVAASAMACSRPTGPRTSRRARINARRAVVNSIMGPWRRAGAGQAAGEVWEGLSRRPSLGHDADQCQRMRASWMEGRAQCMHTVLHVFTVLALFVRTARPECAPFGALTQDGDRKWRAAREVQTDQEAGPTAVAGSRWAAMAGKGSRKLVEPER